ncbi:MAG: Tropinone reductase 1, partial [Rhodothermales bacterium]
MLKPLVNSHWRLDGRLALVTGASRGLGYEIATEFSSLGADLILVARGEQGLAKIKAEIALSSPSCKVRIVSADIATQEGRDKVVAVVESLGE